MKIRFLKFKIYCKGWKINNGVLAWVLDEDSIQGGIPQHKAGKVQDEPGQYVVLESKKVLSRMMGMCQKDTEGNLKGLPLPKLGTISASKYTINKLKV